MAKITYTMETRTLTNHAERPVLVTREATMVPISIMATAPGSSLYPCFAAKGARGGDVHLATDGISRSLCTGPVSSSARRPISGLGALRKRAR